MFRPILVGVAACALVTTTVALAPPSTAANDPAPTPTASAPPDVPASGGDSALGAPLSSSRTPALSQQLAVRVNEPSTTRAALGFLKANAARYAISDPDTTLVPAGTTTSGTTTVERFDQRYHGLPVLGAQYVVRLRDEGDTATVTGTSGRYFSELTARTDVTVSSHTASQVARHSVAPQQWSAVTKVQDHGLVVIPTGPGVVARHLTLVGHDVSRSMPLKREVYVAPGQSRPVLAYDDVQADGPVSTTGDGYHSPTLPLELLQQGSAYLFQDRTKAMFPAHGGVIETYDGAGIDARSLSYGGVPETVRLQQSPTVPVPASVNTFGAIDAHWGAGKVYDFYRALGRDSLDGKGGPIRSVVNVAYAGQPFVNAFWNGEIMVYGTGGGDYLSFAASLDVVGHEMTHGVVDHTADLLYVGQSGAVNEAFADYFGNTIENATLGIAPSRPTDGLLGEDLCRTASPRACALRDMNALMTTLELYRGVGDNGGVHLNSPIVSGALWQIRHELGVKATDKIVYDVLTQYLTPLSQFIDVREATIAAARAHGVSDAKVAQIEAAFTRHGIVPNWERRLGGTDTTLLVRAVTGLTSPENAGNRYVLANYDLQTGQSRIYTGTATTPGMTQISPTAPNALSDDTPATDGRSVVWTRNENDGQQIVVTIKSRPLSGGPVTDVVTLPGALVWDLAVDGRTVAWEMTDENDLAHVHVRLPSGKVVTLPGREGYEQANPDIDGEWIVYSDSPGEPTEFSVARLMRYNTRTGASAVIAEVTGLEQSSAYIYRPQIVGDQVLFLGDAQYRLRTSVLQVPLAGGRVRTLVAEGNPLAPLGRQMSANEQIITWENYTSFEAGSTVYAKPRSGGEIQRVSCSPGSQFSPLAGARTRVIWLDTSSSSPDLVTRAAPRGTC